jgi:methylenetetrahydrofolate reductase (NADPH)
MEFKPPFIDVTYHREEYVYRKHPNGLLERKPCAAGRARWAFARPSKTGSTSTPVPHLICGGFTKEETENALIDLHFLGIDSVLALRGDPIKSEGVFKPEPDGHAYASDLIGQVANLNKGEYLDQEQDDTWATNFCIGTAGYPEKHFEAPTTTPTSATSATRSTAAPNTS